MTSVFDYYELAHPKEGVGSGFKYKIVPHITLKQLANDLPFEEEVLYDQPLTDNRRIRVAGPFTVESVPAAMVKSLEETLQTEQSTNVAPDTGIAREGETYRQQQWQDELGKTGVRAKGGAILKINNIVTLSGTRNLQAQGETDGDTPEKVLIVFGPEHAAMDARQVENAINEARLLKPDILLFCAFQFDEEAAKDIDETPGHLIGFKLLKAQMNMDLQTEDLKKQGKSNQSFWLIGQPDIQTETLADGQTQVSVRGFDYYNPKTGKIDSGGPKNIAMWMLDTDYDGRSLFPSQIFFPMAGAKDGWGKLAKALQAEIDGEKIAAFKGTVSLPFKAGKKIAVKIIDDRGIESLKVINW
jgi:adenine-specific DNA-methyltransferase